MRNNQRQNRLIVAAALTGVAAVLVYFFPLFHIVRIETAKTKKEEGKFNAKEYVDHVWTEKLPSAAENAIDAVTLLDAIKSDPAAAKKQFSRQLGMGNTYYFFVKGSGRIVSIKPDAVGISFDKTSTKADLTLSTANIYGNTIRDGLGLFDVNEFQSSQEFNQISSELNKRVETGILPALRQNAVVGKNVGFAGSAEVADEKTDLQPLRVIPVKAEIQ